MQQNKATPLIIKSLFSLCLILSCVSTTHAVNLQYLRYSPVASFTAEDFEMLQTTGSKALNSNEDGKTSEWKNPESNNSGSITPLRTSTIDGNHCRKVKIVNQSKNRFGETVFTFCKIKERWKLLK